MPIGPLDLPDGHRLVNVADEPSAWRPADVMCSTSWPEFMLHDPVADRCWGHLRDVWPRFQLVLLDSGGAIAAAAQAAPLLEMDLAADRGVYYDANVWTVHDLRAERTGG